MSSADRKPGRQERDGLDGVLPPVPTLVDPPTEPIGPPLPPAADEAGTAIKSPGTDNPRRARGGAHRRDSDGERRWIWLVAPVVVAVLAGSALLWLLDTLSQDVHRQNPAPPAVISEEPPGPEATASASERASATTTAVPSPVPSPTASAAAASATTPAPRATRPSAPPEVPVPDVVGKPQGAAAAALRSAGFAVSTVSVPTDNRSRIRRVLAQRPGAGQTAPRGSTVTIFVGVVAP